MTVRTVSSSAISIVIQGPFNKRLPELLRSTQLYAPEAEVILSTWKSDYEKVWAYLSPNLVLVVNDDIPSEYFDPISGVEDNLRRQIVTTMSGLERVSRPYTAKLRSDTILTGSEFFQVKDNSSNPLLQEKITTTNLGFVDPAKLPYLGYYSDMAMFGRTSDLMTYWRLNAELKYDLDLLTIIRWKFGFNNSGFRVCRFGCEQQLAMNFVQKLYPNIRLGTIDSFSTEAAYYFEKVAASSFHMLSFQVSGLDFGPKFQSSKYISTFYEPSVFEGLRLLTDSEQIYRRRRLPRIWIRKYIFTFFNVLYYKGIMSIPLIVVKTLLACKIKVAQNDQ